MVAWSADKAWGVTGWSPPKDWTWTLLTPYAWRVNLISRSEASLPAASSR